MQVQVGKVGKVERVDVSKWQRLVIRLSFQQTLAKSTMLDRESPQRADGGDHRSRSVDPGWVDT